MKYKRAYLFLVLGETLWLFFIVITPVMAFYGLKLPSQFFYYFYSHFCHQLPERSLFLYGEQLPVCARDTAVYAALLATTLIYPLVRALPTREIPSKWYLVVFLFPIALDGGTQLIGLRESTNMLRIITGAIAGSIVPFYLIPLMMASTSIDIEECHGHNREDIDEVSERVTRNGE
jgi:uncharacterized membrane protein